MTLFLITAPSGAGKTSIAKSLEKMGVWKECISHTTREIRKGEKCGEEYYFVSDSQFSELDNFGAFAEKVEYFGNKYGVSNDEIDSVIRDFKNAVIVVNHEGYKQIKEKYPDAVGIFLYMTKEDCVINMLSRGDSLDDANSRASKHKEEMKDSHQYDYVVKNVRGKMMVTQDIIKSIVNAESNTNYYDFLK